MRVRSFCLILLCLILFSSCSASFEGLPESVSLSPKPKKPAVTQKTPLYIPPEERLPRVDRRAEAIYQKNPQLTPVDFSSPALLPLTEDAGEAYLEKLVFLCDSPNYWLKPFGLLPGGTQTKQVWTGPEGTMTLAYLRGYRILDPYDNTERTIPQTVSLHKPEYIVIALGLNGVSFMDEAYFTEEYVNLIREIRAASPETILLLQSIYPISPKSRVWGSITNAMITRANSWILKIAEECGCHYLDSYSCLVGEDGNAKSEWSLPDGFHPNREGLERVLEYIRTHAYFPPADVPFVKRGGVYLKQ